MQILEGLYKSKLQDSVQLQTVLALYDQETVRNNGHTSYLPLKTSVKLHIDPMMRTRNFRVRSEVVERGAVTKSQKGKKAYVERQVGQCFQWKAHGQCSKKGDSCSFSHDRLVQGDLYGGQRRKGRSSSPAPNSEAKTDGGEEKNPRKQVERKQAERKALQTMGAKFRAVTKNVKTRHVDLGILPCVKTTSLRLDACLEEHVSSDMFRLSESPAKSEGAKGSVAFLKESTQFGCVTRDSYPRKSILREEGHTWHQIETQERQGPSRGIIPKCAPHERSPCAPNFGERSHEETLHQERCARRVAWDLAKNFKNADKAIFDSLIETKVTLAPISKSPEEREFVVDSGASMHMMSIKELSSDELDTVRRSRNPTVVLTANWEVHTNEEAQVYVHDLNLFVTVQLLEEKPAVLSLGKLCADH